MLWGRGLTARWGGTPRDWDPQQGRRACVGGSGDMHLCQEARFPSVPDNPPLPSSVLALRITRCLNQI